MATTTTVHVELGAAFWLLLFVLIGGTLLCMKLGSEKMSQVLSGGVKDAFNR